MVVTHVNISQKCSLISPTSHRTVITIYTMYPFGLCLPTSLQLFFNTLTCAQQEVNKCVLVTEKFHAATQKLAHVYKAAVESMQAIQNTHEVETVQMDG